MYYFILTICFFLRRSKRFRRWNELNFRSKTVLCIWKKIRNINLKGNYFYLERKSKTRFYVVCSSFLLSKNEPFLFALWRVRKKESLYNHQQRTAFQEVVEPKKSTKITTIWWSASGFIHYNFYNPDETISGEKHCQEIDKMDEELKRLRPSWAKIPIR